MLLNNQKPPEKFKTLLFEFMFSVEHIQSKSMKYVYSKITGLKDLASKYSNIWHKHAKSWHEYLNVMPKCSPYTG